MNISFEKTSFSTRLKSMLAVDLRRMFTTPLFYTMAAASLVIPILILVMTSMLDGTVSTDPNGVETTFKGFENVWQIIGSVSGGEGQAMAMDITSMCNINLMFFIFALFVCLFVGDDFRSGYCKNLFTTRAKKTEYIISKTIVCFVAGAAMLILFFVGAMLGGAIANLPFTLNGATAGNIVLSLLSKIFLVAIFSAIYILGSVVAKQRLWLSLILSFGVGMLFFMMVPMITPLNCSFLNFILCLVGSGIFSYGIGVGSYFILKKTNII